MSLAALIIRLKDRLISGDIYNVQDILIACNFREVAYNRKGWILMLGFPVTLMNDIFFWQASTLVDIDVANQEDDIVANANLGDIQGAQLLMDPNDRLMMEPTLALPPIILLQDTPHLGDLHYLNSFLGPIIYIYPSMWGPLCFS
ncbi:hypothetical protein ACJX0J_022015, partial [Zea mays]